MDQRWRCASVWLPLIEPAYVIATAGMRSFGEYGQKREFQRSLGIVDPSAYRIVNSSC